MLDEILEFLDGIKQFILYGAIAIGIALLFAIGLAVVLIIISSSKVIPVGRVGIMHYTFKKSINTDKVYKSGRHWIGPARKFFTFPATVETISKSVSLRSFDGITITCDISYQFQVKTDRLIQMFTNFGHDYASTYDDMILHTVRTVASKYNTTQFYDDRIEIGADMSNETISVVSKAFASLTGFQLRGVQIPQQYEFFIQAKTAQIQLLEQARNEYQSSVTNANTKVIEASNRAQVAVLQALGEADGQILGNLKAIEGDVQKILSTSNAYEKFSNSLGFTSQELISYMWIDNIRNAASQGRTQFISVEKPNNFN